MEIWWMGEIPDGGRSKAIQAARIAQEAGPAVPGYRIYVVSTSNPAGFEWAKAEITRRRKHEVLFVA